MNEKTLSICMSGRNDDYTLNFKYRFQQSVDFLAYSAEKAGVLSDIEVVFADWNSDIPLHNELKFTEAATKILKFVVVPPEVAEKHNCGNTPFHTTKALNVAIRRATGKYIASMPGDILIADFSIGRLISLLRDEKNILFDPTKSQICIPRKIIPHAFYDQSISIKELDWLLSNMSSELKHSFFASGTIAGTGVVVYPKHILQEYFGLDESLAGHGHSDTELCVRLSRILPIVNLEGHGIICYDFAHEFIGDKKRISRRNTILELPLSINNENWGLVNYDLSTHKTKYIRNQSFNKNKVSYAYDEVKSKITNKIRVEELKKIIENSFNYISSDFIPLVQLFPKDRLVKYLDLGLESTYRAMLSSMNQFSHLYFIPQLNSNNALDNSIFESIVYDNIVRHMGVVRCIAVEPKGMKQALKNNFFNNNTAFDIIRYNCDYVEKEAYQYYKKNIREFLKENGILVFYGSSEFFQKFFNDFKSNEENYFIMKCNKYNVGVLLNVPDKKEILDDEKTQLILEKVWAPPFRKKERFLLGKIKSLISLLVIILNRINKKIEILCWEK